MTLDRKLRTCFITFMLLASTLSVLIILPETAKAEATGETVLYFHDVNMDMGKLVDEKQPTAENYTVWPPNILPLKSLDEEAFLEWFTLWTMKGIFDGLEDTNDMLGFEEMDGLFGSFEELMEMSVGSPLGIFGMYEYTGEETLQINGDVKFNLFVMSEFFSKLDAFKDSIQVSISSISPKTGFPSAIKNKTVDVDPKWFKDDIQNMDVVLEDVDHTLKPGDTLVFSVKIIPGDKPIGNFLDKNIDDESLIENLEDIREKLSNESSIEYQHLMSLLETIYEKRIEDKIGSNFSDFKSSVVDIIDTALELTNGTNITSTVVDVVNALRSSSIVYDSPT